MSFPTTASFVPNRIEVLPPPLSFSFLSILLCFPPSFFIRCPDKTFLPVIYRVTNGVPRGLYSRVAVTPLASSPWPAHAIYLSRLRDSSLRSPSFSLSHSSSRRFPCNVPLQPAHSCIIRVVEPFSSISFRGRRLFRAYFRYVPANSATRIFFGSGSSQFTRVSVITRVDVSAPISTKSENILPIVFDIIYC